jgi:hypothetical protein
MANDTYAEQARRKHLEILLERLTSHADVLRHHLPGTTHNASLGLAAEAGVRDVLRMVLPKRLAVTSGFIRRPGGDLIVPTAGDDISVQTDVLIYDASRTCPLYGVEGVEVLAAPDVLGVIEVKDSGSLEDNMGPLPPKVTAGHGSEQEASQKKSAPKPRSDYALDHIAELAKAAPQAFRGIVLIQGSNASSARDRMEFRNLTHRNVPHVVYCRTVENTKTGSRDTYLAFHEYLTNRVHFHAHDPGRHGAVQALAGFLRIVTGFFAAQGLASATISSDLRPLVPPNTMKVPSLALGGRSAIGSLRDQILEGRTADDGPPESPSYEKMLRRFFGDKMAQDLRVLAVGLDPEGRPTSGALLQARWDQGGPQEYASFFTMSAKGVLTCADAVTSKHNAPPP